MYIVYSYNTYNIMKMQMHGVSNLICIMYLYTRNRTALMTFFHLVIGIRYNLYNVCTYN